VASKNWGRQAPAIDSKSFKDELITIKGIGKQKVREAIENLNGIMVIQDY